MKYLLPNERVRVVQGDQEIARKCYVESLKLKRTDLLGVRMRNTNHEITPHEEASESKEASYPASQRDES